MVVIDKIKKAVAEEIRGKIGNSRSFGEKIYTQFQYGEEEPILGPAQYGSAGFGQDRFGNAGSPFGIYQIKTRDGKQHQIKIPWFYPSNPRTELQQANRSLLADAVASWQSLGEELKEE